MLCAESVFRLQVFQQTRGWSPGIGGLAFLGLLVGMMIGVAWTIFITNPRYIKTAKANGGRAPPEERLQPSLLGAPLLIIGLAWCESQLYAFFLE